MLAYICMLNMLTFVSAGVIYISDNLPVFIVKVCWYNMSRDIRPMI